MEVNANNNYTEEDIQGKLQRFMTEPDIVSQYEQLYLGKEASAPSCRFWTFITSDDSFSNNAACNKALLELGENENVDDASYSKTYPRWSYLTLRQVQNTQWAEERLDRGNELTRSAWASDMADFNIAANLLKKAEDHYKEGLDMIPQHSGLLYAYGFLCYKCSRFEQAHDLLAKALVVDPTLDDSEDIRHLLNNIQKKIGSDTLAANLFPRTSANMTLSDRAEKALKDAMAEKDLLLKENNHGTDTMGSDETQSSSSSSLIQHRKKRTKRKHHKNKKHKKSHHKKRRKN